MEGEHRDDPPRSEGLTPGDPLRPERVVPPRPSTDGAPEPGGSRFLPPRPMGEGGPATELGSLPPRPVAHGEPGSRSLPPRPVADAPASTEPGAVSAAAGLGEPVAGPPPAAPPSGYGSGPVPPGAWGAPAAPREVFELASWGRRVGAYLIDAVIVGLVALAVLLALTAAFGGVGFIGGDETGYAGVVLGAVIGGVIAFAISLLYAPLWMARTNGQTLGRQVMGIRVVRANGRPTDFWWSALRESVLKTLVFGGIASGFSFGLIWLLDVLWPLWDDQSRALHDFIVDSRVVRA